MTDLGGKKGMGPDGEGAEMARGPSKAADLREARHGGLGDQ